MILFKSMKKGEGINTIVILILILIFAYVLFKIIQGMLNVL